jgi:hypothetical protein
MGSSLREVWAPRVRLAAVFLVAYGVSAILRGPWSPWLQELLGLLPAGMWYPLFFAYQMTLYASTLMVVLSVVGRALGARKGSWAMAARWMPRLVHKVLHWVPALWWLVFTHSFSGVRRILPEILTGHAQAWVYGQEAGIFLSALGMAALARFAIKRATAAVHEAPTSSEPVDPKETVFTAVAVTWATRAAVGAVAVLPIAFVTAMIQLKLGQTGVAVGIGAYVATAFGSVVLLRRVSRIKVGIDGVYVMGSGPATFFAWSNVDEVRAEGVDIVLRRRGKVVLRLQLHGADQTRSDALVVRFAEAMAAAERTQNDASHLHAAHAVSAAAEGNDRFLASTHGATDYRQAAVPRDQLWEVVEGAAAEPSARVLAAEALATSALDADDRARLRIAAEHCAEPRVRIALEELLDEDDAPAEARELPRLPL